jgi:uncharacterized integral membrane protein
MRFLTLGLGLLVFLFLFVFAIKNAEPVTLRFFFDQTWDIPLSLLLLIAFIAGVLAGLLATFSSWFKARRNAAKLSRELKRLTALAASDAPRIPAPDAVPDSRLPAS